MVDAECHPTKGYKIRPGWHCTSQPIAPHLRDDPESGRVWVMVEIKDYEEIHRPINQGGLWFIAKKMKVLEGTWPSTLVKSKKKSEKGTAPSVMA